MNDSTITVAIIATLDTKAVEAAFLSEQIRDWGLVPLVLDVGVIGSVQEMSGISREEIARAGGQELSELLVNPSRETAGPVMTEGASRILGGLVEDSLVQAVIGIGGTQGTSTACKIMGTLPFGFPKIMVSTVASGDTSAFVGIKDITMMFSVCDLLGLNPLTRTILGNAAAAACGMASQSKAISFKEEKPVIAMTNLGVLTNGALLAQKLFEEAGFEVMIFHGVGSGGRAMEQMMKDGLITGVFDYALGEIADEVFGGLRASSPERLSVATQLNLPQVIVPGGAEHLGLFVDVPNQVPERYRNHQHVFHSPIIFVPRLNGDELTQVAQVIGERLHGCKSPLCVLIPEGGTSRYAVAGGPLFDPEADATFFDALDLALPESAEVVRFKAGAEDQEFVAAAVAKLVGMIDVLKR